MGANVKQHTNFVPDDVAEPHAQIVARHTVHPDAVAAARVLRQDDADGLATLLSAQHHRVPSEELQLVRLVLVV